jgi:hypothetical protein
MAAVCVSNRKWAELNPNAFFRKPLTIEEVLSSKMLSTPLRAKQSNMLFDGGSAFLITSAERARDMTNKPVYVLGDGSRVTHFVFSQEPDITRYGWAEAGKDAFREALQASERQTPRVRRGRRRRPYRVAARQSDASYLWRNVIPELKGLGRIIAPDLIGQGDSEKLMRLVFDGVDYFADVWLNGEKLGSHEGAYTRFGFDITKRLGSLGDIFLGRVFTERESFGVKKRHDPTNVCNPVRSEGGFP